MPRLAIFDIDGTLTATNAVDDECYFQAAAEVYGPGAATVDWSGAPHVTDSAIAHWLSQVHRGRPPSPADLAAHRTRFLQRLRAELAVRPDRFGPVAGAPACSRPARGRVAGRARDRRLGRVSAAQARGRRGGRPPTRRSRRPTTASRARRSCGRRRAAPAARSARGTGW
jgi:hypothetical protein